MVLIIIVTATKPYHLPIATARRSYRGEPTPSGYRDINISVMFGGHVCEVQIQLAAILEVKAGAHKVTGLPAKPP